MESRIKIHFRGHEYPVKVHLSLQDDGCYIFTFLEDKQLINEFGSDIDIHTDCDEVLPDYIVNDEVKALKVAILNAVQQMDEFKAFKMKKLIIRSVQMN